ncbi:MAG: hypothetical protein ACOC32_02330 [Nanoarchaeota archaeon]
MLERQEKYSVGMIFFGLIVHLLIRWDVTAVQHPATAGMAIMTMGVVLWLTVHMLRHNVARFFAWIAEIMTIDKNPTYSWKMLKK